MTERLLAYQVVGAGGGGSTYFIAVVVEGGWTAYSWSLAAGRQEKVREDELVALATREGTRLPALWAQAIFSDMAQPYVDGE